MIGGDANTDRWGITDTTQGKIQLAMDVGMAIINPIVGIPMLAAPFIMGALTDIADNDDRLRAEHYDKYYRARDEYRRGVGRQRNLEYNARNQASREEYERRMAIVPILLTQKNVEDTFAASEARLKKNQETLESYQRSTSQKLSADLLAQSRARQAALTQQTQQQIDAINAKTAAQRAAAEAQQRSQQQMQGAFSSVIDRTRSALQQQSQAYRQNLATSQSVMQTAQQITEQRQRLNQQLATQASETQAMRAAQLAELKARTAPRLPPKVGGSRQPQYMKPSRLEGNGIPSQYLQNLTKGQRTKQTALINKSKADYKKGKVEDRPKVSDTPTKRSSHVIRFEKKYGFPVTSKEALKATFPDTDIEKILSKGAGAYGSSGSRPNVSIAQWSYARLASVLTGGPSLRIDKDLVGPISLQKIKARGPR